MVSNVFLIVLRPSKRSSSVRGDDFKVSMAVTSIKPSSSCSVSNSGIADSRLRTQRGAIAGICADNLQHRDDHRVNHEGVFLRSLSGAGNFYTPDRH